MFSWSSLPRPIVALAPMADMTDLPFSLLCKEHGAPVIVREMVSAEAVVRHNEKTLRMAKLDDRERPVIQQIFGSDPHVMAEAARIIVERFHPDGIDINMGCPVYNIVSNFNGAFLIKDHARAQAIVRAIKNVVAVPVSVKTRLGWSRDDECLDFVCVLADAGTDVISMHGRTKEQGYSGTANWKRIGEARKCVPDIPFLVNGDITTISHAQTALAESDADGVLIGRGALGNPWFFHELTKAFQDSQNIAQSPSIDERCRVVLQHAREHVAHYGDRGLVKLRKHLPWYFKGLAEWKETRSLLVRISTIQELEGVLKHVRNRACALYPNGDPSSHSSTEGKNCSGFTGIPCCRTSKCKCGPVESPAP